LAALALVETLEPQIEPQIEPHDELQQYNKEAAKY
jgi:hypothetical protein